jgi:N-acetylneuraminic acid mutarotase
MKQYRRRRSGRAIWSCLAEPLERLERRWLFCDTGAQGLWVNAGGPAVVDSSSLVWQADEGFDGGTVSTTPFVVKGTPDQSLYSTRRWGGSFDFHAEGDDGGYTLTLLFAEPVFNQPGMRVFDVFVNGQPLLTNFDLVAAAGPKTAVSRSFTVNITNEALDVQFVGVVQNAIVSGIELTPLPIPPAAPSDLAATANSSSAVTLNWTDHANNETGFEIDRSPHGSNQWTNLGAVETDVETFTDATASSGTAYDYRVHAVGDNGQSPYITTTVATPAAPIQSVVVPLTTTTTGPASTLLRINAGGTLYKDSTLDLWQADRGFTGGGAGTDSFPVSGTSDQYLYYTRRYGNFSYTLPADNGNYTLKLYFAERVMTAKNQRVFNVFAEGSEILTNFDIFATAGYRHALVESFPVTVSGGALNLTFQSVVNWAMVSAIELDPADTQSAAPTAPATLTAAGGTNRIDLAWSDSSSNEAGFELERKGPSDANFVRIATLPSNVNTYADTGLGTGATFSYRVRAINNAGDSTYSPVATTSTANPNLSNFTKVTWSQVGTSPIGRSEAQTAVVNNELYVFGGYTDGTTLVPDSRSDVYDPASNTWSPLPAMPVGLTHSGCCTDGRYIYFAGGYSGPGGAGHQTFARVEVWRFDTANNSWSSITSLPQARGAGALVLLGRTLHFFGGTDLARQDRNEHWTLNLDDPNATWQTSAPLPTVRNHLGAVVLNGKIYAVGGQQHQDAAEVPQSAVQMWDPANPGVWTTVASLPQARSHIAAATFVMNGRIIVLGGETTYLHSVTTCSAYDPTTNTWTDLSPLPVARSSGTAGVINGILYYANGVISKNVYKGIPG